MVNYVSISNPEALPPPEEQAKQEDTWQSAHGDYRFDGEQWKRVDTGSPYNYERTGLTKQPWESPTAEETYASLEEDRRRNGIR